MIDAALSEGVVGARAIRRGLLDVTCATCGTSRRIGTGRWTTCRMAAARDGAEARAALPGGGRDPRGRGGARRDRADVAAGTAFTQAEAARLRGSSTWCCAGDTKASTSGCASAGDRGDLDRRLRAERRRAAGARHHRRGGAAGARAWWATRFGRGDSFARGLLDHPHYTRPAEFGAGGARRAGVGPPRARSSGGGGGRRVADVAAAGLLAGDAGRWTRGATARC